MARSYNYRNIVEAKIRKGFLELPIMVKASYSPIGKYVLRQEEYGGYNHVAIFPQQLIRNFLHEEFECEERVNDFLSKSESLDVKIRKNGSRVLKLPDDYLRHVHLERSSMAILQIFDYLKLWNPKEFEESRLEIEPIIPQIAIEFGLFIQPTL